MPGRKISPVSGAIRTEDLYVTSIDIRGCFYRIKIGVELSRFFALPAVRAE